MENVEELDQLVDVEDLNHVADDENGESDELIEPKIGMQFETVDDLYEFYRSYAKRIGFPVRK